MNSEAFAIRTMTRRQVELAIDWAADEGWNPGLHDADCYYAADPEGFLVGMLGDTPIGSASAIRYGSSFGFFGFFIVRPQYRRRGYGLALFKAALARLEGRCVGLDGVVDQQPFYQAMGFEFAHRNIRFEGCGPWPEPQRLAIETTNSFRRESITAYDQQFFPDERSHFLQAWISQPGATLAATGGNDKITAYGVMRPCRTGFKIGPLFADREADAETVFLSLVTRASPQSPIYLDVPAINAVGLKLTDRLGMSSVFETARMYRGEAVVLPTDRIFGVTSFEVG